MEKRITELEKQNKNLRRTVLILSIYAVLSVIIQLYNVFANIAK
jgi:hypothetical protein